LALVSAKDDFWNDLYDKPDFDLNLSVSGTPFYLLLLLRVSALVFRFIEFSCLCAALIND